MECRTLKTKPTQQVRVRKKLPRRMTHCTDKSCRGVLEMFCSWIPFGAKKFGLTRRMMMRQCVKCKSRYFDDICTLMNEREMSKVDKKLTRKRVKEGLLELDEKGKVIYSTEKNPLGEMW